MNLCQKQYLNSNQAPHSSFVFNLIIRNLPVKVNTRERSKVDDQLVKIEMQLKVKISKLLKLSNVKLIE